LHRRAFQTIPTMITLTIINLLKLPFESGMSHHVKATYGSLAVSGCGFRYGNSAPCFAASHFPSLHVGADPQGGISTPVDMYRCILFFVLFVHSFFPVFRGTRRVKERPFNLPLLVKPNEPISGIRLSSGISHSRKRNSYTDNSARFGLQQLFDNLHDLCQMAFSLTLFSGLPFWYLTIRLFLSCCQPLLYPDQNPFAGSGFPST